jgi:hypothetical protein
MWTHPEFGELFVVEKSTAGASGPWSALQHVSVNNFIDYSPGLFLFPLFLSLSLSLALCSRSLSVLARSLFARSLFSLALCSRSLSVLALSLSFSLSFSLSLSLLALSLASRSLSLASRSLTSSLSLSHCLAFSRLFFNTAFRFTVAGTCYRVWGSCSQGGDSALPSNTVCL